ncbi:MAG: 50S ribosomal protein L25 [Candidatus Paceibacterales bacterium]
MITLSAKIRKEVGKKVKNLRKKEVLPAVLYGPKIKNLNLELDLKEFEKTYKEAGESSLISLNVEGKKEKFLVLIHEIQFDPLADKLIHVDFYQPRLEEEIEAAIPIIFEGEAPAVKELRGTLVKNISEVEVKAKPQDLPREIKVNIENLKTLEDNILIGDLQTPKEVKILRKPNEIVVSVSSPEKVEEELEKPIEEKIEEVEKVEEEKEEEKEKKETQ